MLAHDNLVKENGASLTQGEVVVPAQPPAVGSINVQMYVGELQAGNRVSNARLVNRCRLGTQLNAHVGHQVAQRVGLENNGKVEVLCCRDLLHIWLDELLLVSLEAVLLALELAGTLASTAVPVGQVVEDEADDLLLPCLLLHLAGLGDGSIDVGELGKLRHPHECADLLHPLHIFGVDLVALGKEGAACLLQLGGPYRVDELCLAGKGIDVLGRVCRLWGGVRHRRDGTCRRQRSEERCDAHFEDESEWWLVGEVGKLKKQVQDFFDIMVIPRYLYIRHLYLPA